MSNLNSDDRREALAALRARLAYALDDADPQILAGLAREFRAVLAEIDGLPGGTEVSPLDQLAAKRADRRSNAPRGEVA